MARPDDIRTLEAACLSCLFTNAGSVVHVGDILTPEDFEYRKHGVLFGLIMQIAKTSPSMEMIDYMLVVNKAQQQGMLKDCGGADYILTISDGFAPSHNPISYATAVFEESRRRQIADTIRNLQDLSDNDDIDTKEVSKELRILTDIMDRTSSDTSAGMDSIARDYLALVRDVYQAGRPLDTLRFGLHQVDKLVGGLMKTDVMVCAARPGQGKTSLGFNIILNNAASNPASRGIMFSMEMSKSQAFDRMVSNLSGIQTNLTRHRAPTAAELHIIESTSAFLAKKHIVIEDKKSMTIGQIRALITNEQRKHGRVDYVILDYLQLISPSSKTHSRAEAMGEVARAVKVAAGDLQIPIIALAQLNRASEKSDSRPRLSDIRESGDIEAAADQVILLHNPGYYEADRPNIEDVEFIVAKNRHGDTGIRTVQFERSRSAFISSTPADRPPDFAHDPDDDPFA